MKRIGFGVIVSAALLAGGCEFGFDPGTPKTVAGDYSALAVAPRTILEMQADMRTGAVSAEGLTRAYLERIAQVDDAGPELNAVLAINPTAVDQAIEQDAVRARDGAMGRLAGVPILLKDNIETLDEMATTAGSLALVENYAGRDAPVVARLRAEGAVILGKTNLSEWANFRANISSSGWSAVGGQTKNPHSLGR